MSSKDLIREAILKQIKDFYQNGIAEVSPSQLLTVKSSVATIRRNLNELVLSGHLVRIGKARATRYRLTETNLVQEQISKIEKWPSELSIPQTLRSRLLLDALRRPLAARSPVTYQRKFVDDYIPNKSSFLPPEIAEELFKEGRLKYQQPSGTYARQVLEQLLIDLSWSSSRLEGDRHSLIETAEIFKKGFDSSDADTLMLLNHKRSIEFLVDAVPNYGLTNSIVRNLQSLLMQDLIGDPRSLGEIRNKIVNISDTVYVPSQVPALLEEMLYEILARARNIKNPVESAFFLWVNLAYLQPFEDGNKRTSRLAANIPLMIYNCAPLSFLDVNIQDYAYAMTGVYELLDTSLAADLFVWIYRRSIQKYSVVLDSIGAPDPFRLKYRHKLSTIVKMIVDDGKTLKTALKSIAIPVKDKTDFLVLLKEELKTLTVHNCARFRLSIKSVETWIKKGRRM